MNMIDERKVLDFYLEEMDKDSIVFLKNKPWYKEEIAAEVKKLKEEKEMHNKIKICKNLWKVLFEASMGYIDPDRRGYDDLFQYFDEYVNFEELIFASDSFYRDHTMHCLWVYFLGEYIFKNEEFKPFLHRYGKENEGFKQFCEVAKNSIHKDVFKGFLELGELMNENENLYDSLRCLAALTHDLGYPIKKINSINKNIKGILPHFGINNYNEFDFSYSDIHDNLIKDFLNLMCYGFKFIEDSGKKADKIYEKILILDKYGNIVGIKEEEFLKLSEEDKEVLMENDVNINLSFNYSSHVRYSKDFESYQHGIMSAFLLFRKLSVFNNKQFSYVDYKTLIVDKHDIISLTALSNILVAITDHTSDGFQICEITGNSSFLTFIDELEEFSRISRANQNRQYINEFCKSNIYVQDEYLNIDFTFDNTQIDNLDPERAFKGRCKRFLTLFNVRELDDNLKIRLRCIGNLPYDNNVYMLEIRKKFANITINGEEKSIPKYLKSKQFFTKEEYSL
ncbi:hypothetical protein [Clostridium sp. UBA4548]|uniref:hypothetical protein n=1 Tax=Clostridium sp. UBA4548 TaxID=1946361 RepID=UPI0025C20A25|nr:hypothetical protein [Clostridium sp. UBA4548]